MPVVTGALQLEAERFERRQAQDRGDASCFRPGHSAAAVVGVPTAPRRTPHLSPKGSGSG